ncbi:hypothetical protein [Alcanivorax sp. 1008]|uniref:hypothetical protein n=1 Tax=Alcanivorax sp. 1008 TaxID=2816853 RepID=UPI001D8CE133|nr:hypothetical protein [Alcanivorax sp. 1008]MCC1496798.1 hypothetical protein [Alcanivorax sp. 1008]
MSESENIKGLVSAGQLAKRMVIGYLIKLHGAKDLIKEGLIEPNTEWNDRVEAAYEAATGGLEFDPALKVTPRAAFYAQGFPGEGKSTAFKIAARDLSRLLRLNCVVDPSPDYEPDQNRDFVFITENLAGQNSIIDVGGIPDVQERMLGGKPQRFLIKRVRASFAIASAAAANLILFDDISNASPAIQDTMLSICLENKFQDLQLPRTTLMGYTGNYGAMDGTNAMKVSAALRTRVQLFNVQDTCHEWCDRINKALAGDPLGSAGTVAFLRAHGDENFRSPPPKGAKGAIYTYPAPRTWSFFLTEARAFLSMYSQMEKKGDHSLWESMGYSDPWDYLEDSAVSSIGPEAGHKYRVFAQMMYTEAAPLARAFVENGSLDDDQMKLLKEKVGAGRNADEVGFANQFLDLVIGEVMTDVKARAQQDSATLAKAHKLVAGACYGLAALPMGCTSLALNTYGTKLLSCAPNLADNRKGNEDVLNTKTIESILDAVTETCTETGRSLSKSQSQGIGDALAGRVYLDDDVMAVATPTGA